MADPVVIVERRDECSASGVVYGYCPPLLWQFVQCPDGQQQLALRGAYDPERIATEVGSLILSQIQPIAEPPSSTESQPLGAGCPRVPAGSTCSCWCHEAGDRCQACAPRQRTELPRETWDRVRVDRVATQIRAERRDWSRFRRPAGPGWARALADFLSGSRK